ncbi:transposase, partial [Candidatus Burkholderia verschuerenii]|uniref:transposase n=1 Tax=Candidatus Burkholderia verschuerenii TaxID=242163 RepID=UPI001E2F5E3F
ALYRKRNLVERFFKRIKHFRRVATRYDKLAHSYLTFVSIVSALAACKCEHDLVFRNYVYQIETFAQVQGQC